MIRQPLQIYLSSVAASLWAPADKEISVIQEYDGLYPIRTDILSLQATDDPVSEYQNHELQMSNRARGGLCCSQDTHRLKR